MSQEYLQNEIFYFYNGSIIIKDIITYEKRTI